MSNRQNDSFLFASIRHVMMLVMMIFMSPSFAQSQMSQTQINHDEVQNIIQNAQDGNVNAQFTYAVMLLNGQNVIKDEPAAVGWLTKAASKGYVDAQYNLGICYLNGIGTNVNYSKSIRVATKSGRSK